MIYEYFYDPERADLRVNLESDHISESIISRNKLSCYEIETNKTIVHSLVFISTIGTNPRI